MRFVIVRMGFKFIFTCNSCSSVTCVCCRSVLSCDSSADLLFPTTKTFTSPKNGTVKSDFKACSLNKSNLHSQLTSAGYTVYAEKQSIWIFLQMAENLSPISTMSRSPFISPDMMIII